MGQRAVNSSVKSCVTVWRAVTSSYEEERYILISKFSSKQVFETAWYSDADKTSQILKIRSYHS